MLKELNHLCDTEKLFYLLARARARGNQLASISNGLFYLDFAPRPVGSLIKTRVRTRGYMCHENMACFCIKIALLFFCMLISNCSDGINRFLCHFLCSGADVFLKARSALMVLCFAVWLLAAGNV